MDTMLINLPIEINNKIFFYLSHPCADIIKNNFANIAKGHLFTKIGKCYRCKKRGRKLDWRWRYWNDDDDEYYFLCKPCHIIHENKQIEIKVKRIINRKLRNIFTELRFCKELY